MDTGPFLPSPSIVGTTGWRFSVIGFSGMLGRCTTSVFVSMTVVDDMIAGQQEIDVYNPDVNLYFLEERELRYEYGTQVASTEENLWISRSKS